MKKLILFLILASTSYTFAQTPYNTNIEGKCSHQKQFENQYKYQRDSSYVADMYNMNFIHLDLIVNSGNTSIEGSALIHAQVLSETLDTIYLELNKDFSIDSMRLNGELIAPVFEHSEIFILVDEMYQGDEINLITYYHGISSSSGGFFSGVTTAFNETYGKNVTWTLSEPFSARDWFPVRQNLNDKIDSVYQYYTCVDSEMVGSNGNLTEIVDNGDGTKTYKWQSNYPISYYLLSFAVSDYMEYNIYAKPAQMPDDSVLIQNFIYNDASCLNAHQSNIDMSTDMLELLSEKYGLYPFSEEKYGNCLAEIGGGMEHQTMTTIGSFSFGLNIHEMGHMWYGDNITCATWSDIWINEGFASYTEYLGAEFLQSQSTANSWMNSAHNYVMGESGGSVYVPEDEVYYGNEWRIFDGRLSYKKGAAILHQIRYLINDDEVFFEAMQNYTEEFTGSIATGIDFKNSIAGYTNLDFDSYFDQWYFGEGYPTYSIEYSYNSTGLFIAISQTTSSSTPFFDLPLEIRLDLGYGEDTIIRVPITDNLSTIQTEITDDFIIMQIDPNNWIINQTGSIVVGTKALENNMELVVGPNPTHDFIQISFKESDTPKDILISDLSGRVMRQFRTDKDVKLDISDLNSGYYIVKVTDGETTVSRKILKQ